MASSWPAGHGRRRHRALIAGGSPDSSQHECPSPLPGSQSSHTAFWLAARSSSAIQEPYQSDRQCQMAAPLLSSRFSTTLAPQAQQARRDSLLDACGRSQSATAQRTHGLCHTASRPATMAAPAKGGECVAVAVRCRPLNSREAAEGRQAVVQVDRELRQVAIGRPGELAKAFTFDVVFGEEASQEQVYEGVARRLVDSVMQGYNGAGVFLCVGGGGGGGG